MIRENSISYYETMMILEGTEVDEMKLKLSTKIMKGLIAKLIVRVIRNKIGCNVDIQLNALDIELLNNGQIKLHTDVDVSMDKTELMDILAKSMDED